MKVGEDHRWEEEVLELGSRCLPPPLSLPSSLLTSVFTLLSSDPSLPLAWHWQVRADEDRKRKEEVSNLSLRNESLEEKLLNKDVEVKDVTGAMARLEKRLKEGTMRTQSPDTAYRP